MAYKIVTQSQLPKVEVTFFGEHDVEEIIASKKEFERQRLKSKSTEKTEKKAPEKKKAVKRKLIVDEDSEISLKRSKLNDSDDIELALAALEGSEVVPDTTAKPTSLFDKSEDISAKDIYNFLAKGEEEEEDKIEEVKIKPVKEPDPIILDPELKKIADTLEDDDEDDNDNEVIKPVEETPSCSNIQDQISSPKTSTANLKPCMRTPASTGKHLKVSFNKTSDETEVTNKDFLNGNTPHSLRKRYVKDIRKIQKILEDGDDEDEDFSESGSEYELSGSSSDEESTKPVRRKLIDEEACFSVTSDFFELQNMKKKTSNNKLETVKLSQNKIEEIFQNIKVSDEHQESVKNLLKEYSGLFDKWEFTLEQNYNILLYGVGSKKQILTQFSKKFINKYPVIVVNGYFPNLSIKEVIDRVCSILKINITQNIHEMIDLIEKELKENKILIVINNIDGLMLRSKKTQLILSRLAKIVNIYVIASIDHINAPLIWDQSMLSDFNWMWCDCTTFFNYTDETNYESNILLQNSRTLTLSSLRNVFSSLTKNSKQIFLIILNYQLENFSKNYVGISFKDLYRESRKELLVTSDLGLRSQLKEFLDHCILKLRKTPDGEECYYIAIDNQILKQFLEEQT